MTVDAVTKPGQQSPHCPPAAGPVRLRRLQSIVASEEEMMLLVVGLLVVGLLVGLLVVGLLVVGLLVGLLVVGLLVVGLEVGLLVGLLEVGLLVGLLVVGLLVGFCRRVSEVENVWPAACVNMMIHVMDLLTAVLHMPVKLSRPRPAPHFLQTKQRNQASREGRRGRCGEQGTHRIAPVTARCPVTWVETSRKRRVFLSQRKKKRIKSKCSRHLLCQTEWDVETLQMHSVVRASQDGRQLERQGESVYG